MAKKYYKAPKHTTGRSITTKTPYGSTSDMIVTDPEMLKKITVADHCVLMKDDDGYYITNKNMVDSGLADPMRHDDHYRHVLSQKIVAEIETYDAHFKEQNNEQSNVA